MSVRGSVIGHSALKSAKMYLETELRERGMQNDLRTENMSFIAAYPLDFSFNTSSSR